MGRPKKTKPGRPKKATSVKAVIQATPTKKRRSNSDTEWPPTPIARPWKVQVQSARANFHMGKRISRSANTSSCTLRRSARLSGVQLENFSFDYANLSKMDKKIQKRAIELQNVDNRKLKQELAERGRTWATPKNDSRPTYDLQNPNSVLRKFIDTEADRLLDERGDDEFQCRPGAVYLKRTIFDS